MTFYARNCVDIENNKILDSFDAFFSFSTFVIYDKLLSGISGKSGRPSQQEDESMITYQVKVLGIFYKRINQYIFLNYKIFDRCLIR